MSPKNQNFIDEETFKKILSNVPIVTVDVLFFNEDYTQIVLFKRNNEPLKNQFFTPGGRLLKNEDFLDSAVRQMQKELGIFIKKEKLIFGSVLNEIWEKSSFATISYHTVNICFGYSLDGKSKVFQLDGQHDKSKWFDINDPSLHELIKKRIEGVLQKSLFRKNN